MKTVPTRPGYELTASVCVLLTLLVFNGCKKEPPLPNVGPAHGTLQFDKYGGCAPSYVHGIFYNGRPAATDTNWVDVMVYVTSPGSYTITTGKIDGVSFSGSGNLWDTGVHTIRLKATGIFINPGGASFPVTFDSSRCSFIVQIQDTMGLSIPDNTWTFTAGGHVYSGPFTLGLSKVPGMDFSNFRFTGHMASGASDTVLYLNKENDLGFYQTGPDQTAPFHTIFRADSTTAGAAIDLHFNNGVHIPYEPWIFTRVGTFNGTAWDSAHHIVNITNAKFKYVEQL